MAIKMTQKSIYKWRELTFATVMYLVGSLVNYFRSKLCLLMALIVISLPPLLWCVMFLELDQLLRGYLIYPCSF